MGSGQSIRFLLLLIVEMFSIKFFVVLVFIFFFFTFHKRASLSFFFCDIATVVSTTFHCLLDIYLECVISGTHNRAQGVVCVCGVGCRVEVFWGEIIHYTLVVPSHQREKEETSLYSLKWNKSGISPLSLSPSSYFNHFVRCLVCRRAYSNFSL